MLRAILAASLLLAFGAFPAAAQDKTLHEEQSLYRNIFVNQDGDQRCLLFRARKGLGRESCIYLSKPDVFVFDYAPMMMSSLYLNPDPKHILMLLERMGASPERAVMIGDSIHDAEAAHRAGIPAVLVSWGYTLKPASELGADDVIDRFDALPDALGRLATR